MSNNSDTVRSHEEIEQAFRDMGLTEATWGRGETLMPEIMLRDTNEPQYFIRIDFLAPYASHDRQ